MRRAAAPEAIRAPATPPSVEPRRVLRLLLVLLLGVSGAVSAPPAQATSSGDPAGAAPAAAEPTSRPGDEAVWPEPPPQFPPQPVTGLTTTLDRIDTVAVPVTARRLTESTTKWAVVLVQWDPAAPGTVAVPQPKKAARLGASRLPTTSYQVVLRSQLTGIVISRQFTDATSIELRVKPEREYRVEVLPGNSAGWAATATRVALTVNENDVDLGDPVQRQLAYLRAHWNSYNTKEFGDFNKWGGDCANFVSQSLFARGWSMTKAWSNKGGRATTPWVYVPALDKWLQQNRKRLKATRLADTQLNRMRLKPGDVIIFDWNRDRSPDHTMIVRDVRVRASDGRIEVMAIGHNLDLANRSIDVSLNRPELKGKARAWFYSLG